MKLHLPLGLYHAVLFALAVAPSFLYAEQAAPTPEGYTTHSVSTVEDVTPYARSSKQAFLLEQDLIFDASPRFTISLFFTSADAGNLASLVFQNYSAGAGHNFHNFIIMGNGDVSFNNNHTGDRGGAIFDGEVSFNGNVSFTGNSARLWGGAIFSLVSPFSISHNSSVSFTGNSAPLGGAIYSSLGSFFINNNGSVSFTGNTVTDRGGAICGATSVFSICGNESVSFIENSSGIYCILSRLNIANNGTVIFRENTDYSLTFEAAAIDNQLTLSARPGGSIEFYDPVYISKTDEAGDFQVSYNQLFEDEGGERHAQTGDIVFAGQSSEVLAMGNLYDGRLIIKDGAVYRGQGIFVHSSASASDKTTPTLLLQNGTLNNQGYDTTLESGTELALTGVNAMTASSLNIGDGGNISFTLDERYAETAALALTGDLVLGGHLEIKLDKGEGSPSKDKYKLITLTDGAMPTADTWTSDSVTVNGQNGWNVGFGNLQWEDGTLYLTYSFAWTNGTGNGVWDTNSANWLNGSSEKAYMDGTQVIFGDEASGTVTLEGELNPSEVVVNNSEGHDYVFDGEGSLAGGMNLVKSGDGKLTVNTENSYTGGTEIKGGSLVVGADNALGTGQVDLQGGTLDLDGHHVGNAVQVSGGSSLIGAENYTGDLKLTGSGTAHVEGYRLGAGKVFESSADGAVYEGSLTLAGGTILLKGAPLVVQGPVTFTPGAVTTIDVSLWPEDAPLGNGAQLASFADNSGYKEGCLALSGMGNAELLFHEDTGALTLLLIAPVDTAQFNGSQGSAYHALEQIATQGTVSGELGSLVERVLGAGSSAEAAALLDRASGASLATAMNSQLEGNLAHLRRLRQNIGSGQSLASHVPAGQAASVASAQDGKAPLAAPTYLPKRMSAYVNAYNSDHTLSADSSGSGMRRTEWGGVLGMEGQISESLTLGAALSAGRAKVEPTNDARYHEETAHVDLYAVAGSGKGWQSVTSVGVGFHSFDFRRHYLDGRMATADGVDGFSFNAMEEVNYTFEVSEQARLQPFFAVQTSVNSIDSFSESGAGNASLQGESRDAWATDLTLGARYLRYFRAISHAQDATLSLQAGVTASVGDLTADLPLHFQGAPEEAAFMARSARGNRWGCNMEASLTLPVSEDMAVFAAGSAILRGDSSEANAQMGVKVKF